MFKIYLIFIFICLIACCTLAERKNNIIKTTSSPLSILLNKFHQSDFKLTYEWSEFVHGDEHFAKFYHHTFKYNRTTTAINATFVSYTNFRNEVEVIAQAYKFASNEYREFPIRFQFNLCEAINKGTMGLDKFSKCGNVSCPILKGKNYHYCNWNPEERSFPPFIPTGKYMLELQLLYRSKEFLVTRNYGSIYRPVV